VLVCGGFAFVLSLGADRIYDLIQSASSFASSGIFVILVLGLFTRLGGSPSALASLVTGTVVWVYGANVGQWDCPYLVSLGAALGAYLVLARWRTT
jgi:Na+/proline symporter